MHYDKYSKKNIKRIVRGLKKRTTLAERIFKNILCDLQHSYDFRWEREKPFLTNRGKGNLYIADFYLREFATIVEIDGGVHSTVKANYKDTSRSDELLHSGKMIKAVLRFSNKQVIYYPWYVSGVILKLKYVRLVKGNKERKKDNVEHNLNVMRENECIQMVFNDPDLEDWEKGKILKQVTNGTYLFPQWDKTAREHYGFNLPQDKSTKHVKPKKYKHKTHIPKYTVDFDARNIWHP